MRQRKTVINPALGTKILFRVKSQCSTSCHSNCKRKQSFVWFFSFIFRFLHYFFPPLLSLPEQIYSEIERKIPSQLFPSALYRKVLLDEKKEKNAVTNDEIEEEKVRNETKIACLRPRPLQPPKRKKQKRNAAEGRKEGIREIERWKERRTESSRRLEVGE